MKRPAERLLGPDACLREGEAGPCAADHPARARRTCGATVSGILSVDKPGGLTSHDLVARVRRLSNQQRVGHAGTLDPLATGVLLVCLGQATRLVEYLAAAPKAYRATVRFGASTDTWDAEGQIVATRPWEGLTLQTIEGALSRFLGLIDQVPPMYSALKRGGQPLYRLARKGQTVERKPRRVEIHDLRVVAWQPPELVLEVNCSKGTYIRSLANELGQVLGPGAYLSALVRLEVGRFRLAEAVSLDILEAEREDGIWRRHLWPASFAVEGMPGVVVDADVARRIIFGQQVALELPGDARIGCAYDRCNQLLAILRHDTQTGLWQPDKVLAVDSNGRGV